MNALDELLAAGATLEQYFTPAYVAQAKAYVEPLRARAMVDLALMIAEYALFLGLGLHVRLSQACERAAGRIASRIAPGSLTARLRATFERIWRGPGAGATALFVVAFVLLFWAIDLPESLYFDFFRERREGLVTASFGRFAGDELKVLLVHLFGYLSVGFALYALMRWLPRRWWLVVGVPVSAVMLVSAMADPYKVRLLNDYSPLPEGPQRAAITEVLAKGHVAYQNVLVMDASKTQTRGNAFFAGEGPTRVIVLYDTMLKGYTPQELAVVVAHEMGHLQEPIWMRRSLAALVMVPLLFLFHLLLTTFARRGWLGLRSPAEPASFPLVLFFFSLLLTLANPLSNWSSRAQEREADRYALELTQAPGAFASMMAKLTIQNRADPVPPAYIEGWMAGHPASARRIAMALRFAHEHNLPLEPK